MAGRFSRRVRGWAKKNDVPVVFCVAGDRKHKIGAEHKPSDPNFRGIYAVLIKRAPEKAKIDRRYQGVQRALQKLLKDLKMIA
jgi:hypothetical protein